MINSISVLFVTLDAGVAGEVVDRIRYRGQAVRYKQAGNARDLERLLQSHRFDAILLVDAENTLRLDQLKEVLERTGFLIPVVLITDQDTERQLSAIDAGAFAVADAGNRDLAAAMTIRAAEQLKKDRELSHLQTLLREADRRYLLMLDSLRHPVACFHSGDAVYANEAWRECFEIDLSESLDRITLKEIVAPEQAADLAAILSQWQSQSESAETCERLTLRTRQGRAFDADVILTSAILSGESCTVVHLSQPDRETARLWAARRLLPHMDDADPSEPAASDDMLTAESEATDLAFEYTPRPSAEADTRASTQATPSTPVPEQPVRSDEEQRNAFLRAVADMLVKTAGARRSLGLATFALDAYAQNPEQIPDVLERAALALLRKHFPPPSVLARIGDGIYTVLLPSLTASEIKTQLDALLRAASWQNVVLPDGSGTSSALSCGVALVTDDSRPAPEEFLQRSLRALAEAQANGGNGYRFHTPAEARATAPPADSSADLAWKARIEDALQHDRLRLQYQPIISLQGEDIPRYSVFVGLTDADGEVHEPRDLMPAAERSRMMAPLDRWVMQQAIGTLSRQLAQRPDTIFFMKLSSDSLDAEPVVTWLDRFLQRYQVAPGNIVVELRELTILTKLKRAVLTAKGLKDMGVGLCIAGFGNGQDPFRILQHVDATYIRLDSAFVKNLTKDEKTQAPVHEIAASARNSGRKIIIPRVESAETLAILFNMEIDLIQGDFVQPPSEQLDFDFSGGP